MPNEVWPVTFTIDAFRIFLVAVLYSVGIGLTGCITTLDKEAFDQARPQTIGIIVGHDIGIIGLTSGQQIGLGVAAGVIGLAAAEAFDERRRVAFDQRINGMVSEGLVQQIQAKGYKPVQMKIKEKKWSVLENIDNTPDVYSGLLRSYETENTSQVDAILFFEYMLELRPEERGRSLTFTEAAPQALTIEGIKLKYAKSKIWLYDTKAGKRLYFDMIQRGYWEFSNSSIEEALQTLINLESIPPTH